MKDVYSKDTFSINSIFVKLYKLFQCKFNFFHCVTDMKIINDVFSKNTFSINLILWYYGNDISLV